jgi:PPM family protein phosphatase
MTTSRTVAYGQSHVGKVREDNQDSIRLHEPPSDETLRSHGYLYAVADGMGGYEHGGVASELALETCFNTFYAGNPFKSPQNLRHSLNAANLAVYQSSQRLRARMGTTLSVINLVENRLHIAHVGDSRVYLVRGGAATCLTNDHTMVGELVRMRVLSPDKVRTHDRRSVLQKCLGLDLFVQPDIVVHPVREDDYLILCTDGVWAYVEDDEFAALTTRLHQPEQIAQALIDLALERDSDDNVSAVVVHLRHLASAPAEAQHGRSLTRLIRSRLTGKA